MSQEIENELKKLQSLQLKNDLDINNYKDEIIKDLKGLSKEDIVSKKNKKSIWTKIKMVLGF